MIYVLAIFLPPIALFARGQYIHGILNIFLCLLFWFPGSLHAVLVIMREEQERRQNRLEDLIAISSGVDPAALQELRKKGPHVVLVALGIVIVAWLGISWFVNQYYKMKAEGAALVQKMAEENKVEPIRSITIQDAKGVKYEAQIVEVSSISFVVQSERGKRLVKFEDVDPALVEGIKAGR